jgi:hypothetical protein
MQYRVIDMSNWLDTVQIVTLFNGTMVGGVASSVGHF